MEDNVSDWTGRSILRYSGEGDLYNNGFKIQLSNDHGVAPDQHSTGSLFSVEPPIRNAAKVGGAWNTFKMQVEDEDVQLTINDVKVLDTIASDPEIATKGFVALDGIEGGIVYRKVLLIELPRTK